MKLRLKPAFITLLGLCLSLPASASLIQLVDWGLYLDGTFSAGENPHEINAQSSLDSNSLGNLRFTIEGEGEHTLILFMDFDIDEHTNSFFNEHGLVAGSPKTGQSWEIDEPGYVFGDIYTHLMAGALDNTNNVSENSPDDVSFALAWDFSLSLNERGYIDMNLSESVPDSAFYLQHADGSSDSSIYFSSLLQIASVPEPHGALLMLLGLGLIYSRRSKR